MAAKVHEALPEPGGAATDAANGAGGIKQVVRTPVGLDRGPGAPKASKHVSAQPPELAVFRVVRAAERPHELATKQMPGTFRMASSERFHAHQQSIGGTGICRRRQPLPGSRAALRHAGVV